MAVGSERGTTHFDVVYADQMYVGGSITGSVINGGTETITQVVETNIDGTSCEITGTITGSVANVGTMNVTSLIPSGLTGSVITGSGVNCKGTITGSVANITTIGLLGTASGGVWNGTIMNAAQFVGSRADVKGTVTGSFLVGTVNGAYAAATIPVSGLKAFSCVGTQVTAANGSFAHGLGAIPAFVSVVPSTSFIVGTDARPPWLSAAVNATDITLTAGTTGTVNIYALA